MKKALVIGIDAYPTAPLSGCVNDAEAIAQLLEKNGDGSPNFSVVRLTSDQLEVKSNLILGAVTDLFQGNADVALLYFAGHGILNSEANSGYLVSQNGEQGSWGLSLTELMGFANKAYPKINSTVVILDSCHSGFAGEVSALNNPNLAVVGTGVTMLSASHRDGQAKEQGGQGLFTSIFLDGLSGSSADVLGRITPASIYSHVDQTLGPWEQRPIYKANVQTFINLRQVMPKIPHEVLRNLPIYFPDEADTFKLDPSFEPDRENVPMEFRNLPVHPDNVRAFKELQLCNRHGLVVPVDAEHMYFAAIHSTGCRLTALGAHYRRLVTLKRL